MMVYVTLVTPNGKLYPFKLACRPVLLFDSDASKEASLAQLSATIASVTPNPVPTHWQDALAGALGATTFAGQFMVGGVASFTVTVNEQDAVFGEGNAWSATFHFTVVTPELKTLPLSVAPPEPEVAPESW